MLLLFLNKGFSQKQEDTMAWKTKYIIQATTLRKTEHYKEAIKVLDSALLIFNDDPSILLFKGDLQLEANHFASAVKTLKSILPTDYEKTITRINLSYALFMDHKPELALKFARHAWENDKKNVNASVNYFNAMLWNMKTRQAGKFLSNQVSSFNQSQRLVLLARLHMTSGQFIDGFKYYDSLIIENPDKHFIREYAEVLLNKQEIKKSFSIMSAARSKFSDREFNAFNDKLTAANQRHLGVEYVSFNDIANNTRTEYNLSWRQGGTPKYRFTLKGGHAIYRSPDEKSASTTGMGLHVVEKFSKLISGETEIRFHDVSIPDAAGFTAWNGQQIIRFTPNDRRMFAVSYSRDLLNFTTTILGENIRSNYFGYITHIMFDGKTGFYSQGSMGSLTDQNRRYQFFGSMYRMIKTVPMLKSGINFSALHFSDSLNKAYFSPDRYMNAEYFMDFSSPQTATGKIFLQIQAAAGVQKINKLNWERSARIQTDAGFRSKRVEAGLKYQYSNVALNSGTGYSFHWTTMYLIFKW
jgi:tetratricopeptide (TPR) repeat protein